MKPAVLSIPKGVRSFMEELGAVYYYKLWLGNMHFKVGLTPYCQMKEGIGSLKASWMLRAWGSEVQSLRKGRQRN